MEITTAIAIINAVNSLGKTIRGMIEKSSSAEEKQQLMSVLDDLMTLKHQVDQLGDENRNLKDDNRDLKEKLRFKADEFGFDTPFYYNKKVPDRPLCAKCFAKEIEAPMGEPEAWGDGFDRHCLVCGNREVIKSGSKYAWRR